MAASLSDIPGGNPETVEKSCRGNRYCSFTGPFHPEHLAIAGRGRPHVVGRCYGFGCGAYVCDRCAHRRPLPGQDGQLSGQLAVLCCPFDGEPLGRGDEWLVLSPEGRIVHRSAGIPRLDAALEAALLEGRTEEILERRSLETGLLAAAVETLEEDDPLHALALCDRVLEMDAGHALAWRLRQESLERLKRHGEAWTALRMLLRLDTAALRRVASELTMMRLLRESGGGASPAEVGLFRRGEDLLEMAARRRARLPEKAHEGTDPRLVEALRLAVEGRKEETLASLRALAAGSGAHRADHALLHHWIGLELAQLGRTEEAIAALDRALLEGDPEDPLTDRGGILLAKLAAQLGAGQVEEAAALLESLLPILLTGGILDLARPAVLCAAHLFLLRGETDRAVGSLEQIPWDRSDPMQRLAVALLHRSLGKRKDEAEAPEDLDPEWREAFATLDRLPVEALEPGPLIVGYTLGFLEGRLLRQAADRGGGPPLAAAQRGAAWGRWMEWREKGEVLPRSRRQEPGPRRLLLRTERPEVVRAILAGLPAGRWSQEHWEGFFRECEARAGIEFPQGCDAFLAGLSRLSNVYSLLESPVRAQLVSDLRSEILESREIDEEGLYALYTARRFVDSPRVRALFADGEEALVLGDVVAREILLAGVPSVRIGTVARSLAERFPVRASADWRATLEEIARQGLVFEIDAAGDLELGVGGFEDFFLARCLVQDLFATETPDLRLLGRRPIPDGAARLIGERLRDSQEGKATLRAWLPARRGRRGVPREGEAALRIRNLALILIRADRRACGLDLAGVDFSGLDLSWVDFRAADLTGASFRGARLVDAQLYDACLVGATFAGADFTDAKLARADTTLSDLPSPGCPELS